MLFIVRVFLFLLVLDAVLSAVKVSGQATDPSEIEIPENPNAFVNPVVEPVLENVSFVHTREFVQLPDEAGEPAKIVSMLHRGTFLYVCTLFSVYRVSSRGEVSQFLNASQLITEATAGARNLSLQKVHGGVRSIAFPSDFPSDPRFYITAMESRPENVSAFHYISDVPDPIDTDSVLLEFRYDRTIDSVDPKSYRIVFRVGIPVYDHPIKEILFRGSRLYVAHGDGAFQNATSGGGQNADALGKILRIIPFKPDRGTRPYGVPRRNPFVRRRRMLDEVWAYGLRNPHTMCVGADGTFYIGETGRSNVEEVNLGRRGRNYGWSAREGHFVSRTDASGVISGIAKLPENDFRNRFTYPAAVFGHAGRFGAQTTGEAIAGGCPVENGSPMSGQYYYTDFVRSGRLFFSEVGELKQARTSGEPDELTTARTQQAVVCFERRSATTGEMETVRVGTLGKLISADSGFPRNSRVDARLGRGRLGELYWSSKANGKIYLFTSSLPGGPSGPC